MIAPCPQDTGRHMISQTAHDGTRHQQDAFAPSGDERAAPADEPRAALVRPRAATVGRPGQVPAPISRDPIVPLLALVGGQRTVSTLLSKDEWVRLQGDVRARRQTVLMHPCGTPGMLRTSKLGTQFFAHKTGHASCDTEHPGESPLHLAAKAEILRGCADAGWDAEPEHRGDGWVADVLATNGTWHVAFEVQASQQVASEYARRQERYKASGVRAAWFVKHHASVLAPNKDLPTFLLEETDDGLQVRLGRARVPLREAAALLVSGKAPFRSHVSNGDLAQVEVWIAKSDPCWKCRKHYWLWRVQGETVTGRCGQTVAGPSGTNQIWDSDKAEADPQIVQLVRDALGNEPVRMAKISMRYSKTAGTKYMAFSCPYCTALFGDFFLSSFWNLSYDSPDKIVPLPGTVRGVAYPHYCIDTGNGTCLIPPVNARALTASQRLDSALTTGRNARPVPQRSVSTRHSTRCSATTDLGARGRRRASDRTTSA